MLREREIGCNISSAMGNISSDMKEFLHVNAAFILGTLCSSVPWSGICFTWVLRHWHHLTEKWPHVKAAGGRGCFQQLFLVGEPLGRPFSSYVPHCRASLLCWDLSAVPKFKIAMKWISCDALWYMGEMLVMSKCEAEVSCGFCFNERDFLDLEWWTKRVSFPQHPSIWNFYEICIIFKEIWRKSEWM